MTQRPYAMEFYKDPDRHEGVCPVCNMLYVKELLEDRRIHRAYHRSVVDVFEAKSNITLAKLYSRDGQLVPVRWDSPRPLSTRRDDTAMYSG
jgi:hypothetical protein